MCAALCQYVCFLAAALDPVPAGRGRVSDEDEAVNESAIRPVGGATDERCAAAPDVAALTSGPRASAPLTAGASRVLLAAGPPSAAPPAPSLVAGPKAPVIRERA